MEIYIGTLERFGDIMLCVGTTKKQVVDSIMSEYDRVYKRLNNEDPKKNFTYNDNQSDYAIAKENISIRKLAMGKVEFT